MSLRVLTVFAFAVLGIRLTLPWDPPTPPNILLVLMDDVGYYDLYGQDDAVTPTIDTLAANGTVFSHCWAMPICSPSRATLLTGTYPFRHGLGESVGMLPGNYELAPSPQLPALLRGYSTGFFGKWHVSAVDTPTGPALMGFSWYRGHWFNLFSGETYTSWSKFDNGVDVGLVNTYATLDERQEVRRWIVRQEEPWFALWSWTAAHSPYHDPPGFPPAQDDRERFLNAIAYADDRLNEVLAVVPTNTIVIIVGDNGSPGLVKPPEIDNQNKAKNQPYEGGLRVPLIVSGVGIPTQTIDDLVGLVDLHATVLELAGCSGGGLDSESLAPLIQSGTPLSKPYQYAERYTGNGMFPTVTKWRRGIAGDIGGELWKLVERNGNREMYNLTVDPKERFDEYDDPQYASQQVILEDWLDNATM